MADAERSVNLSLYRGSPTLVANSGYSRRVHCHSSSKRAWSFFASWIAEDAPAIAGVAGVRRNERRHDHEPVTRRFPLSIASRVTTSVWYRFMIQIALCRRSILVEAFLAINGTT